MELPLKVKKEKAPDSSELEESEEEGETLRSRM